MLSQTSEEETEGFQGGFSLASTTILTGVQAGHKL